jgi:hypothetical protein
VIPSVAPIRKAAEKRRQAMPSVAFVDAPFNMDHDLAAEMVRDEIAGKPQEFDALDGFIVRSSRPLSGSVYRTTWISWVHRMPGGRLTEEAIQKLSDDILRCTRRQPARIDVAAGHRESSEAE